MDKIDSRIAEGIRMVGSAVNPAKSNKYLIMPIGFDGAILYHLLAHYYEESFYDYKDDLEHTVHISSQFKEADTSKFDDVLDSGRGKKVYGLDLRTKTGSLGRMLKQMLRDYENKSGNKPNFCYTVLFDPNLCAGLRCFSEDLADDERPFWLPQKDDLGKLFYKENGV